ncbi:MAG: hypothetical protein ACYC35_24080 [Pirellulales bacterium]
MDAIWDDTDQLRWKMGPARSDMFVGFWLAMFVTCLTLMAVWN